MQEIVISPLPVIAIFVPALAALNVYWIGKRSEYARDVFSVLACLISFVAIALMLPHILKGEIVEYTLVSAEVAPIPLEFRVDFLSLFIALELSFDWALATAFSHRYMERLHARNRFYAFMLFTLATVVGVLLSKNLFILFIFFEVMLITSYVLVIHEETRKAMDAGKLFLFLGIGTGLFLLLGVIMTQMLAGTVELGRLGIPLDPKLGGVLNIVFVGLLIGTMGKAGIFPVHIWLPVAHPIAPSPASAILSGVLVKEGCYVMIRSIYDIFGLKLIGAMGVCTYIVVLSAFTIIFGSALAIKQTDLKTMLGYSTVSQMGYIYLGMALLTPLGLQAAILHIFHHSMMKSALFLCSGAIIYKIGTRDIRKMVGIGRKMPITMTVFTIAALSMIGVPPLVGFVTKWYLASGALEAGTTMFIFVIAVLALSAMMNLGYFGPIIINAFFGKPEHKVKVDEVPRSMLVPMVALAVGIVFFGLAVFISLVLVEPVIKAIPWV